MNRTVKPLQVSPPLTARFSASGRRRTVQVTNLAGLTHQLALARSAAAAAAARHRDDLNTIAGAYRELLAEHVELKTRFESAEQVAHMSLVRMQSQMDVESARVAQLQVQRDELAKTAHAAREAAAKLTGQLSGAKDQIADLLGRLGVPASSPMVKTARPGPRKPPPLVPRVITTARGAKKT